MDTAATRTLLQLMLTGPLGEQSTHHAIREMAVRDPPRFFEIATSVLASLPDDAQRPRAYARLLECRAFLEELIRIGRYSNQELLNLCAAWIKIDGFLDVRLARLLARDEDQPKLSPELLVRVLEVLHHISPGPRLILLVNHLKHDPHPLVAEKATLLVGRRIRNSGWVRQRLASTDAGIRAAAVEGLWGNRTPAARLLLTQSRADTDGRVVANALLGLHFLGESSVCQWVKEMACDQRPSFRRCAVWAMGQIGEPELGESLHAARADSEADVRLAAEEALAALRKAPPAPAQPPVEEAAPQAEDRAPQAVPFRFRFDGSLGPRR